MTGVGWGGDAVGLALDVGVSEGLTNVCELVLGSGEARGEAHAVAISPTATAAATARPDFWDAPPPPRCTSPASATFGVPAIVPTQTAWRQSDVPNGRVVLGTLRAGHV